MRVQSADLIRYNANDRGKSTGDCVKRALSLATGMSYNDIAKELLDVVHKTYRYPREGAWRYSSVWSKVVKNHGGSEGQSIEGNPKLNDFIDNSLPKQGTFLVTTGSKPNSHSDHIVCIIDGKLYDSWDSRDQYVYKLYTFGNGASVERKADIDIASMPSEEVKNLLYELNYESRLDKKASAMLNKKGYLDGSFGITAVHRVSYKIVIKCAVVFPPNSLQPKERVYKFDLNLICTPFETRESFQGKLDTVVNVRLYDRMYTVLQNEAKDRERSEVEHKIAKYDDQKNRLRKGKLYLDETERRAFNSLPGWAQALATYFSVYAPNQYHDSYELYMIPLPDDPYRAQNDTVVVLAYNANELKQKLEEYHDTFEINDEW